MNWISVDERLPEPGVKVIAYFKNELGMDRRIMAFYALRHTIELDEDDDYADYSEEKDEFFLPEGWYEHNEFDEIHWSVDATVTHWMPLPEIPKA